MSTSQARVKQLQSETAQLEEMLALSEHKTAAQSAEVQRLQRELQSVQSAGSSRETAVGAALQQREAEVRGVEGETFRHVCSFFHNRLFGFQK